MWFFQYERWVYDQAVQYFCDPCQQIAVCQKNLRATGAGPGVRDLALGVVLAFHGGPAGGADHRYSHLADVAFGLDHLAGVAILLLGLRREEAGFVHQRRKLPLAQVAGILQDVSILQKRYKALKL